MSRESFIIFITYVFRAMDNAPGSSKKAVAASSTQKTSTAKTPAEERERLIKEFVLITKTDSNLAAYFLGEHDWNLQVIFIFSLSHYFVVL